MVFQGFDLQPHMTALANVSLTQRHVLRQTRAEADRRSAALLARVGLSDKLGSRPAVLEAPMHAIENIRYPCGFHPA